MTETTRPPGFGTVLYALQSRSFAELDLARDTNGVVTFSRDAMQAFCRTGGLSLESLSDDSIAALIDAWYMQHRMTGGAPDPVAEKLISEALETDTLSDGQRPRRLALRFRAS